MEKLLEKIFYPKTIWFIFKDSDWSIVNSFTLIGVHKNIKLFLDQ